MDIRMPGINGLEATRRITGDPVLTGTRVLVLTTFELDEYVFGALHAGASGFLLKGGEPAELLSAVRVVAGGESLLAPSVTRRLIQAYTSRPAAAPVPPLPGLADLTAREHEVLRLIATGLNNSEIAAALHLSPLTAKTHVSRILTKLDLNNRVQVALLAHDAGSTGAGVVDE
jgi:DNA-binding NarL/FixJ family response regulator